MDFSSVDDEGLIDQIVQSHDQALGPLALSALYDRYSRLVFSLAIQIVGDQETAEEIMQDVFFRVWEKAHTYRSEQAKVSTWLTSITRYRAIDVLRRRGVRAEQYSIGWEELAPNTEPADPLEPEVLAEQLLMRERVRQVLAQLPDEQQQALAFAYLLGLSHREISEQLDVPLGTIKTRIRLAMQKLRAILSEEVSYGDG